MTDIRLAGLTDKTAAPRAGTVSAPRRNAFRLYAGSAETLLAGGRLGGRFIVTPNLDHFRLLSLSNAFRAAYRTADVVLNDSRLLNRLFLSDAALCLPGSELAPLMLERLPDGARIVIIGQKAGVSDYFRASHSRLDVTFVEPTMGYVKKRAERRQVIAAVLAARPDCVFVCTGAPQSELVGAQLKRAGYAADILCCGSAFNFLAGIKSRAPRWVGALGAEWLWRFTLEPATRKRYAADALFLLGNLPAFIGLKRRGFGRFAAFSVQVP